METLHVELRSRPGNKIRLTTVYPYMVNTGLCKQPVIRFKSFLPLVNPEAAAKHIIDAQRRDIIEVTIPEFLLSLGCFLRMFPSKVLFLAMDFIGSYLESDKI
ncbi:hypothetical protein PPYR_07544 [Photinus pyralis]|uniref:Uncharacterized protein n=1 Tax=Photinus pyralis TaxID=7054 RepID=A0A5N4ADZ6_PHOPY|nr:hypothetical protein PPYR_12384 [Photinus pyralis]KAB0799664.1 hypothetical protein PPYR_07544 [Photinus pyralis]